MAEGEKVDIGTQFKDLSGLKDRFGHELNEALKTGDPTLAKSVREDIEKRIIGIRKNIKEELDPYKVNLRDQIGKEFGYSFVGPFSPEGIAKVQQGDQFFFVDETGNDLFGDRFKKAGNFSEGIAIVKTENIETSEYLLKPDGQLIAAGVINIHDFSGGFALFEPQPKIEQIKYGFIDKEGLLTNRFGFDEARSFKEGIAWVRKGENKWQMLDRDLKLNKRKFSNPFDFSEGLAVINGLKTNSPLFGAPTSVSSVFYIDKTGSQVFPEKSFWNRNPRYTFGGPFSEGFAWVKGDHTLSGAIDKTGKVVINASFLSATPFSEGLSIIQETGKPNKVFINNKGEYVIESGPNGEEILSARKFKEGIGAIKTFDGWFFINHTGSLAHQEAYGEIIEPFTNGVARVFKNHQAFYIDKRGRRLFA